MENGVPKKATYTLSNEMGDIISQREMGLSNLGSNYYNEIKDDLID